MNTLNTIINGDVLESLRKLPDQSVHTCVTSPPYWGLRDYGHSDQIGLEKTPEEYVERMVEVFREVRRVLRDDGTLWLNLGDSYFRSGAITNGGNSSIPGGKAQLGAMKGANLGSRPSHSDLKTKDLVGIPWRVAFALQADGWYLRSDIIWEKGNCMPESVRDRPTKAHEYIFLLTKNPRYYYDADAIREPFSDEVLSRYKREKAKGMTADYNGKTRQNTHITLRNDGGAGRQYGAKTYLEGKGRNKRTVWTVNTRPFKGAHFAVFPPDLIKPCILAGAPEKACPHCGAPWVRVREMIKSWREDAYTNTEQPYLQGTMVKGKRMGKVRPTSGGMSVSEYRFAGWKQTCQCENNDGSGRGIVLDPFFGSGTTGLVAKELGRDYVGIELNPEYIEIAKKRINDEI